MKTRQEIFDIVWERAKDLRCAEDVPGGPCRYRASNGLACFVGVLIADDVYTTNIEGQTVAAALLRFENSVTFNEDLLDALIESGIASDDWELVSILQQVHDEISPENWASALMVIANVYELKVPVESKAWM